MEVLPLPDAGEMTGLHILSANLIWHPRMFPQVGAATILGGLKSWNMILL